MARPPVVPACPGKIVITGVNRRWPAMLRSQLPPSDRTPIYTSPIYAKIDLANAALCVIRL
jgi:hypothetical protein